MIKKIAFILLLVLAIACGTWGYLYLSNLKRPTVNPLSVLPDTCYVLLETKNLHELSEKLNQGNLMWEELLKADAIKQFNKTLQKVDSLISNSNNSSAFGVQSVYVALYQNKTSPLLAAFNLADINTNDLFVSFLQKSFAAKKHNGNNQFIYECKQPDYTFYVYVNAGLVVISGDVIFLQDAIKNTKKNLAQNRLFTEAYQTSDKESDANMFVHLPYFYHTGWDNFFRQTSISKNTYGAKNESWVSADVSITPSELNTQGFLSNDSSAFYNTLKNQEPISFKAILSVLPYNTLRLQSFSITNYKQFIEHSYAANTSKRKKVLQNYSNKTNADAQLEMENFIGDYAILFSARGNDSEQDYGIINILEEKPAIEFLKTVSDSVFETKDSIKIYHDAEKNLFSNICGHFFDKKFRYAVSIDNGILFSNEISALVEYKKTFSEKNNLLANERVVNFIDKNMATESAYLYYIDVFKCKEDITTSVSKNITKLLTQSPEMLDKYESFALSLQKLKNNLFFKACANFNPKSKLYQNTLWETLLDTDLYMNPTLVKNHLTDEKELVCVDVKNNLYLLSNTGKVLWKRNISEKVLGEIHQVDYFDNDKLQLLFNTENYLHLIDRNGNYVNGFPVKLDIAAANGLTLFDYESTKNYRLWVPLKNNTTFCYTINGRKLIDFSPINNTGQVKRIVLQQKNYFVLIDSLGNINIVNRKGEKRLKLNAKIEDGTQSIYLEEGKNIETTNICYINKVEKNLCKISLTDKVEKISIPEENDIQFAFIDTLQSAIVPQLVCITEKGIDVFDFFGKKVYESLLNIKIQSQIIPFLFKEKHFYSTLEKSSNKLFLMDVAGNKVTDTEIKLNQLPNNYALINNEKPYLVGYYENKVYCIKQ
ncbi:MAG: hypothetical protein ACYDCN_05235 [Bacteroidia bacterium]